MELLARFGTLEQKQKWLQPLLKGKIRSCFAMTEPDVASSDATNLKTSIQRIGESYSVNGRKWWTSGAMDQRCKVILLIGRGPISNAENKHGQHTIVLIPTSTPGVKIHRHLEVFGFDDAPHGHAEMSFTNVIVDAKQALLHTEGGGFEAAQSRLGGGRLHHCMRLVGVCERAQTLTLERIHMRSAFNKLLAKNDAALQQIAQNRCHIESMRSATRRAAEAVDSGDVRDARKMVGVAKILVPRLACDVLDSCIQLHGGMGMCQDTLLSVFYSHARSLRIADGPDEVHLYALARSEVGAYRKSKL